MNDTDKRILASGYTDNAFDPDEKEWFDEHLLSDPTVQDQIEADRQLRSLLAACPAPPPPHTPEFEWMRCRARLRRAPASGWSVWWRPAASGTLALALLLCALYLLPLWGPAPEEETARIRSVWTPKKDVYPTAFAVGKAQVIWVAGLDYVPEIRR